ncbi:3-phenylpropionate MFS transporter, partial [Klebsiella pneumoniae]|nr:3-phenylpropionate MFS transporter [Klebsiella pneumoniae]
TSVTGMLMDIWKHEVILAALVVSTGSLLLTSLLRPRIMPSGEMKQRGPQVKFRVLLKDNAVVRFLLCVSLLQGAHAAYYGFSVIYWQKVGYSDAAIGYLWSLGVVAEVIVFTFSNKLFRRWSAANLLLLSGICGILRWSLLGMSAALPVLIAAQILH